jgi:NADH-quinone oxidoreductase subunit M
MGFVLLGIFTWNELALQGAVIIMLSHGFSAAALFMMVGDLQHRTHTRELGRFGGLWSSAPRMGGIGLFFAMASLGLPGLASFVGEFLVLMGAFQVNVPLTVLASVGLVAATVYSLWMMQKVYYGATTGDGTLEDTTGREMAIMASLMGATLWLGLYPQPVLTTSGDALNQVRQFAEKGRAAALSATAGEGRKTGAVASVMRDGGSRP